MRPTPGSIRVSAGCASTPHRRISTTRISIRRLPQVASWLRAWPKHRLVGLRADHVPGGFLTPVFYPQTTEIKLDAAVRGWLRAELCDAWGNKREGYHLEDSLALARR